MRRETAKHRMERHCKAWHIKRDAQADLLRQLRELQGQWLEAREESNRAHQKYKDAKAAWRTGKEFNVEDADRAAMLHKLRTPKP